MEKKANGMGIDCGSRGGLGGGKRGGNCNNCNRMNNNKNELLKNKKLKTKERCFTFTPSSITEP